MKAIFRREWNAYFQSPLSYLYMGFFLLSFGLCFYLINISNSEGGVSGAFSVMVFAQIFLIPVLTMWLMSAERASKTEQLLLTAPVSTWQIVGGKFLSAISLVAFTLLTTAFHVVVLAMNGAVIWQELLLCYFGFLLLSAAYTAIGMFISSLLESPAVSAIVSIGVFVLMFALELMVGSGAFSGAPLFYGVMQWLSLVQNYNDFLRGVLNAGPILQYISVTFIFLFLTVRVMEKRRWN